MSVDTGEVLSYAGWLLSAVTLVGGWVLNRRGRRATAVKDEADAAESLSTTVATLGQQVHDLYSRLAQSEARATAAESRAAAAEARAAASELRAATADAEVLRLREEVAQLRADLAAARTGDGTTTVLPVDHVQVALVTAPHPNTEPA